MVETAGLQDRSTPLSTCMGLRPKSSQRTRTQSLEASVEWSFRGRPILVATSWLPHQLWFTPNNSRENTAGLTEAVAVHLPRPLRGSPRIGHQLLTCSHGDEHVPLLQGLRGPQPAVRKRHGKTTWKPNLFVFYMTLVL